MPSRHPNPCPQLSLCRSFVDAYRSDFKSVLDSLFTKTDQEWLVSILRRELVEDEQDTVTEAKYRGGSVFVWTHVRRGTLLPTTT